MTEVPLRIVRRFRLWAALLAGFAGLQSWGLWTQPLSFRIPAYYTLLSIAPIRVWSVMWAVVGVLAVIAAVRGQARVWRVASLGAVGIGVCWLVGLSWAHWVDGARLSPSGFANWAWFICSTLLAVSSPNQFVSHRQIVLV